MGAVLDDRVIEKINLMTPGSQQVGLGNLVDDALGGTLPPGSVSLAEIEQGTNGQVIVGQTGSALEFKTLSGDLTIDQNGVATLGATLAGDKQLDGSLITYKDNATSQRLKGPSDPGDPSAGADVQSYAGIFYNAAYGTVGTLNTRASYGANLEMDLAFQSPHALLLIAQDGSQTDGVIKGLTQTNFQVHARYDAEVESPKHLIVDRVDTGSTGAANTSDVTLGVNSGNLYLNYGVTDGLPVAPSLTAAQIAALTPVNGMFVYDSTNNKFQVCEGGAFANVI